MRVGSARGTRLALLGLVAGLHLALLLAWRGSAPPVRAPAPAKQTIQVVMLPAPPAPPTQTLEPAAPSSPSPPVPAPPPRYRAVASPRPVAVPGAPVDAATPAIGAASPATDATPAPSPAPAPLNLELPRSARGTAPSPSPSLIGRALNDPRANTPRLSFEKRMSADFDQAVTVETLADGTKRYRRGAECVLAHPSRAGQLDPFDRVHNQLEGIEKCP